MKKTTSGSAPLSGRCVAGTRSGTLMKSISMLVGLGVMGQSVAYGGPPSEQLAAPTPMARQASTGFDGETVFRGIFFGTGPVAGMLPELWGTSFATHRSNMASVKLDSARLARRSEEEMKQIGVSEKAAARLTALIEQAATGAGNEGAAPSTDWSSQLQTAFMDSIREAEPSFFSRFGADLQSGDVVRVDGAMREGARLLLEHLGGDSLRPGPEGVFDDAFRVDNGYQAGEAVHAAINVSAVVGVAAAVAVVFMFTVLIVFIPVAPGEESLLTGSGTSLQWDMSMNHFTQRLKAAP
jgi:SdpC family antimicrobial peptide